MARPPLGVLVLLAALAALSSVLAAWFWTRRHDPSRPNWAVRLLATRASRDYLSKRTNFPRREAFGAIFVFSFPVAFVCGAVLWDIFRNVL